MINQELFNAIISEVINFNEKVDNWEELVGPGIFETPMVQSGWKIIDFLILTLKAKVAIHSGSESPPIKHTQLIPLFVFIRLSRVQ